MAQTSHIQTSTRPVRYTFSFLVAFSFFLSFKRLFCQGNGGPNADFNTVIDIDIGTNGRPMKSNATKIITFDPGDAQIVTEGHEKYPYVVADYDGVGRFYVNEDEPGCSSLNKRNEHYNETWRDAHIQRRCPRESYLKSRLYMCMHPRRAHSMSVKVRRLSSFLKERRLTKVRKLKIDAQGSDFAIVKDVLDNAPHVSFEVLQVECQEYENAVPLYFTANDCESLTAFVLARYPKATFKKFLNNCMASEYNLVFNFTAGLEIPEAV